MNIILVASLKKNTTAYYFAEAFNDLGHNLLVLSDIKGKYVDEIVKGPAKIDLISKKHGFKPDAIFFIEGGTHRILPIGMNSLNCLKLWYGIDTHMNYKKHLIVSRLFDLTLIAQKEYIENLINDGIKNVSWLPLAFPEKLLPDKSNNIEEREIDISYIGSTEWSVNKKRYKLLKILKNNFDNISFGSADSKKMIEIYSKSKLVFNKSVNNDMNMRFFEAMGSGAILVTDKVINNGVEDIFDENKNYFTYKDEDSLINLVNELLADQKFIKNNGIENQKLILSKHTYKHRAIEVIDHIKNSISNRSDKLVDDELLAILEHKMLGHSLIAISDLISKKYKSGFRALFSKLCRFILKIFGYCILLVEEFFSKIKNR